MRHRLGLPVRGQRTKTNSRSSRRLKFGFNALKNSVVKSKSKAKVKTKVKSKGKGKKRKINEE
jgi:ribosomal protein S13